MTDDTLDDKALSGPASRAALLAGVLLAVALLSGLWSVIASHQSSAQIDRAKESVVELERLLSSVKDIETGLRGFILTGNDAYLAPYDEAIQHLEPEYRVLQGLDVDVPKLRAMVEDEEGFGGRDDRPLPDRGAECGDHPCQDRASARPPWTSCAPSFTINRSRPAR